MDIARNNIESEQATEQSFNFLSKNDFQPQVLALAKL